MNLHKIVIVAAQFFFSNRMLITFFLIKSIFLNSRKTHLLSDFVQKCKNNILQLQMHDCQRGKTFDLYYPSGNGPALITSFVNL